MQKKNVNKQKRAYIECASCGYRWSPEPNNWRAFPIKEKKLGGKTLTCSQCGSKIKIPEKIVKEILRYNR